MKNFNQRNGKGQRDFGGRAMHPATCDECGQACEVPFVPSGGKPIYCNNCFEKNKDSGSSRSGRRDVGRSGFRDKQMFTAVCDKCGKNCEVPFKPSGGKPIFCSDCFNKNRGVGSKDSGPAKEQLEIINSKLDQILKILSPAVKETAGLKQNKKAAVIAPKMVAPKKATHLASESKPAKKKTATAVKGKAKKKKK